ncbi:hypothetical protein C8R44DRAFT_726450 [Mycena epipterygia]|nr:hypothetical protein C8R44DRAFT_726450 [Mycena epipterygia]
MATFSSTSITSERRSSKRPSLISLASLTSIASIDSCVPFGTDDNPIVVTTTISTTSRTYPATVPPPFATSRGSDDILPRPRRGAPPVAPAKSAAECKQKGGVARTLRRAVGFQRTRLDPALCKEWCSNLKKITVAPPSLHPPVASQSVENWLIPAYGQSDQISEPQIL